MLIKESQAILKHLIDPKFSIWFMLCSEKETMFYDTYNFFQVNCWLKFSKHKMTLSHILHKFHKSK